MQPAVGRFRRHQHGYAYAALVVRSTSDEAEERTVTRRWRGTDEHQKMISLDEAVGMIPQEVVLPELG